MILSFLSAHFSYTVLFFWSVLEGEIGLALAGLMVKEGRFDYPTVLAVTVSGALIGDFSLYALGRLSKSRAEALLEKYRNRLVRIEAWFQRFGALIVVFERFIYGTHIPALLMLGVSGFSFWKFLVLDIVGVVLWALTFTILGYYFGHAVVDVLTFVQRHLTVAFLAILFFYAIYALQREEA